jgi:hypothetical protein
LGHKRTLEGICIMSALPPKADIDQHGRDVRFVPKADIRRRAVLSMARAAPCKRELILARKPKLWAVAL